MKPTISSHYSNDRDNLYRFARRAEPPWYPERGIGADGVVMIACLLLTIAALAGVYFSGGGL